MWWNFFVGCAFTIFCFCTNSYTNTKWKSTLGQGTNTWILTLHWCRKTSQILNSPESVSVAASTTLWHWHPSRSVVHISPDPSLLTKYITPLSLGLDKSRLKRAPGVTADPQVHDWRRRRPLAVASGNRGRCSWPERSEVMMTNGPDGDNCSVQKSELHWGKITNVYNISCYKEFTVHSQLKEYYEIFSSSHLNRLLS